MGSRNRQVSLPLPRSSRPICLGRPCWLRQDCRPDQDDQLVCPHPRRGRSKKRSQQGDAFEQWHPRSDLLFVLRHQPAQQHGCVVPYCHGAFRILPEVFSTIWRISITTAPLGSIDGVTSSVTELVGND